MNRERYKWFYDHIGSRGYDLLMKWLGMPFGGEARIRRKLIGPVRFGDGERILEMCCGTGGQILLCDELCGRGRDGDGI